MAGMCRVDLIANVGKDAELTATDTGAAKCVFTVAHSPRVQQGQPERTSWYRCTLVGKRAESLQQYLVKGKQVFVRGDFDVREFTGKDGAVRTSLDVFVSEIELLGSRVDGQQGTQAPAKRNSDFDDFDDSAPF